MEFLAEHQAIRRGETCPRPRQRAAQPGELGELLAVHRVACVVGAGEVADDEGEIEPVHEIAVAGQCGEVGFAHAQAIEPGIDVQRRGRRLGAIHRQPYPGVRLIEAGHDRTRPERGKLAGTAGQDAIEDVDGGAGCQRRRLSRLGERRDEEVAAARRVERRDDAGRAKAVGVGLDDGGAAGRGDALGQRPPVAANLPQIDADDAGRGGRNLLCRRRPDGASRAVDGGRQVRGPVRQGTPPEKLDRQPF